MHSIILFQATRPIQTIQTLNKKTENQYNRRHRENDKRWKMSAPRIILASFPPVCQTLSKLVEILREVLTKTILHSFFETRSVGLYMCEYVFMVHTVMAAR